MKARSEGSAIASSSCVQNLSPDLNAAATQGGEGQERWSAPNQPSRRLVRFGVGTGIGFIDILDAVEPQADGDDGVVDEEKK